MKAKPPAGGDQRRASEVESIEATAAAWLAQRDDALSADDARAFSAWRAADPRHEAAVVRLEGAWATLQPLRDFRPSAARHPDRDLLSRPSQGTVVQFPARRRALALAAAAALALAAGWWALRPAAPVPAALYATTIGGYERVVLADGSVLELNGDTSAEVRFTAAERRVKLARGEAHFTVAKNPVRPFFVEAAGVSVRAVGTAFNVRLGAREVEVLVTEGKVSVAEAPRAESSPLAPAPRLLPIPADTFLVANQRALIPTVRSPTPAAAAPAPAPVIERMAPEAVRDTLAWQGPRLVFIDTPLADVVAQFNRRNTVQLVLGDDSLGTLPIGGSFRPENVESFVRLLESDGDVTADRTDATRLVLRRGK